MNITTRITAAIEIIVAGRIHMTLGVGVVGGVAGEGVDESSMESNPDSNV